MKKKILVLTVGSTVLLSALYAGTSVAQNNSEPPPDYRPVVPQPPPLDTQAAVSRPSELIEAIEQADIVINATIVHATSHLARGGLVEPYSVLHLEGDYATAEGPKALPGRYLIRVPGAWTSYNDPVGQKGVFFISKNGETYNPVLKEFPVDDLGRITIQGVVLINNITPSGHLAYGESLYNSCDISEYHERYNADEDLNNVESFTCENGTQWVRGNDAPADYNPDQGVTAQGLLNFVSFHYRDTNFAEPNVRRGLEQPPTGPLKPSNQLYGAHVEMMDEIIERQLSKFERPGDPENWLEDIDYVRRHLARGGNEADLPEQALRRFLEIAKGKDREIKELYGPNFK